ncbi:MAG: hypothetical protein ACRDT6_10575 [Micromonosporaceae bacterium]
MTRTRLGALCLAAAAVLFVLYPAVRPWHDETTQAGAVASMGSGGWVASHLFAMLGFILVPLGLLALRTALATHTERLALTAAVTSWIGAGLTLPYYGAEDFGLYAVARAAAGGAAIDVPAVADAFHFQPVAATVFLLGLLGIGAGAVLAAVAVWRSETLNRSSGIPYALGFALFIPQFFTPPAVRIGHGVLVGIGCAWLAWELWRAPRR